jgi:hypothetical protein
MLFAAQSHDLYVPQTYHIEEGFLIIVTSHGIKQTPTILEVSQYVQVVIRVGCDTDL